jgi:SAM-dependent methyltransferase
MSIYDESYYTSNNYSNYLERGQRYEKLTDEILDLLNKLGLINKDSSIIDFGCAVGFLLDRLRQQGYKNICGVEISDWARQQCIAKNLRVEKSTPERNFDIMFCLDVFEHIEDKDIISNLHISNPNLVVARIPVADKQSENYYLEISRKDKTHINCKTKLEWKNFFKSLGFKTFLHLNLNTIYDSTGVFSFICLK